MKHLGTRILSFIISFSMLFSFVACQNNSNEDKKPSESEFKLGNKYIVIRGENYEKNEQTVEAMQVIQQAIMAVYGEMTNLGNDYRRSEDEPVNEFEILVGSTNREASQNALKDLGINDYTYSIESENVIVVCGGTPEATLEAAKKFCFDVLGYDAETKQAASTDVLVKTGTTYTFDAEYEYENVTLNGVDLNDITIAFTKKDYVEHAHSIAKTLGQYSGAPIPVVKYQSLTGSEKGVIYVGASDKSGKVNMKSGHSGYLISNSLENGALSVGVAASANEYYKNAAITFSEKLTVAKDQKNVALTLPSDDVYGFDYEDLIPKWYLKSETNTQISDGVIYTMRVYKDQNDLPYRAYILTIDPKKVDFYMGSPRDTYDYPLTDETRDTVPEHMKAAVANGVNVIAGINANFFGTNTAGEPHGLAVKQGVTIVANTATNTPFFGVTKDGTPAIGSTSSPNPDKYQTQIAGSHYILKDGLPYDVAINNEFGYTSHPRTLAGIKEDGTVIFAVIDGRQEKISNGAPLAQCATFMHSLGAVEAINLDGGGSSTFTIRNGNTYSTKNSPSDGELRRVPLSLLLVKK